MPSSEASAAAYVSPLLNNPPRMMLANPRPDTAHSVNDEGMASLPAEWQDHRGRVKRICLLFSFGKCYHDKCSHLHICYNCTGDHSNAICPIKDQSKLSARWSNDCNICEKYFPDVLQYLQHSNSPAHKEVREAKFQAIGTTQAEFSDPFAMRPKFDLSRLFTPALPSSASSSTAHSVTPTAVFAELRQVSGVPVAELSGEVQKDPLNKLGYNFKK